LPGRAPDRALQAERQLISQGSIVEIAQRQNLLIDADDTLWENNIYFERVIASVQVLLQPFRVAPEAFREYLNEVERQHIPIHGYGTLNFSRCLVKACERYLVSDPDNKLRIEVEELALQIMKQPLEIIEGVAETLAYLSSRHSLYLVTKGHREEQSRKIESSGLGKYFQGVEIVSEKSIDTYLNLLEEHAWESSATWMIGNSPRSDINPALGAGLRAVFIPHPHTWALEHEEPIEHPRLLQLRSFSELQFHF
jgi:putative hydrolase of the HAD superfamily